MAVYEYDPSKEDGTLFMKLLEKKIPLERILRAQHKAITYWKSTFDVGIEEIIEVEEPLKAQKGVPGPPCSQCFNEWYSYTGTCLTCLECGHSDSCG